VRGPANRREFVVALKLSEARAGLWSANLTKVMATAQATGPREIRGEGYRGSEWTKKTAPAVWRLARAGQWLILGGGVDPLPLHSEVLARVSKTGRASPAEGRDWLEMDVDTGIFRTWVPLEGKVQMPMAHLTLNGKGEELLANVRLKYARSLDWIPEPWHIPTNLMRDPISSFTASRGIAKLLGSLPGISELQLPSLPSQMFTWAYTAVPFSTHLLFPVTDATNAVRQISFRGSNMLQAQLGRPPLGNFVYRTNTAELFWGGLPFMSPSVHPVWNGRQEYLALSFYPPAAGSNLAPAELIAQVTRPANLAFYGWEITQFRIANWRQFYQMSDILTKQSMPPPTALTFKWLLAIEPRLGNAVTEITVTAPDELTVQRKAHIGLTGFDLLTLCRWIDSPGFPFTFEPPLRHELPKAPVKK
jgi:hypothetical protein